MGIFRFFTRKDKAVFSSSTARRRAAMEALGVNYGTTQEILGDRPFRPVTGLDASYLAYVGQVGVDTKGHLVLVILGTQEPDRLRRIEDADAVTAVRIGGEDNVPLQWALAEWSHKVSKVGFPDQEMVLESLRGFLSECGFGGRKLSGASRSWQRRFAGAEAPEFDEWSLRGFDVRKDIVVWREPKVSKGRGPKETLSRAEFQELKEQIEQLQALSQQGQPTGAPTAPGVKK